MLRIFDSTSSRRDFLTIGSLALGGYSLQQLLAMRAMAASSSELVRDKSVIFLFLHGGPPQTETFDPKMTAPKGVQSVTGEVKTAIPGVTFGATLEKLARLADKFSVVRSFQTGDNRHDIKPIVGRNTFGANLGTVYSRVVGTNDRATGIPTNVALYPRAVDPSTQAATFTFGNFGDTGPFGSGFAPFVPGKGGELQEDLRLNLERDRFGDRRTLLRKLDRMRRELERTAAARGIDRFREQAFDTILGGAGDVFDLSSEDPRVVERYDTSRLVRPESISKRWNNHKNYADNAKTLGKLLLLARRLCEAGCGFVTVTTNFVWDMHADVNNATVEEGMRYMGVPFDHAVSAFIEDVEARGLRDKILLVACGEMGRTPRINRNGGRDHWGGLAPLFLYGGGLKMGQVIGQSTRDAGEPLSTPITIENLIATILHTQFNVGELRIQQGLPLEITRQLTAGSPIPGLV